MLLAEAERALRLCWSYRQFLYYCEANAEFVKLGCGEFFVRSAWEARRTEWAEELKTRKAEGREMGMEAQRRRLLSAIQKLTDDDQLEKTARFESLLYAMDSGQAPAGAAAPSASTPLAQALLDVIASMGERDVEVTLTRFRSPAPQPTGVKEIPAVDVQHVSLASPAPAPAEPRRKIPTGHA
jgi:hypothetical protein